MQTPFSWPYWLIPTLAIILVIPWLGDIDLAISRYFYETTQFQPSEYSNYFFKYGFYPAWISALTGVILLFIPAKRTIGLFLILTLAIGSGLIVQAILKDNWGRPRPRQITEFGGTQAFRNACLPSLDSDKKNCKSFPSGHASVGFYFFALIILGAHYRNRALLLMGIFLTSFLGIGLSYARIAAGGHFFSDVLFSALIMWLTSLTLYYFLFNKKISNEKK